MSRTRCGAKCRFAEPGPNHADGPRTSSAPGRKCDALRCIRGMQCGVALIRHCERSEAIQSSKRRLDCFVASLLAMTTLPFERLARSAAGARQDRKSVV